MNINSHQPWLLFYAVAAVPLFLVMVGIFALTYRRMTLETRFRPLPVLLPLLPCFIGAGAIDICARRLRWRICRTTAHRWRRCTSEMYLNGRSSMRGRMR